MLQLHRNRFVEFVEQWRVWAMLRWRGVKYSKLAAEEVSPYLAHLADVEEHEEELLTPAGRKVSIVRCIFHSESTLAVLYCWKALRCPVGAVVE